MSYLEKNEALLLERCEAGIQGNYKIIPSQIWMPMTNRCNLYCIMCKFTSKGYLNRTYYNEAPYYVTLEEMRSIYENDAFRNAFNGRSVEFCFSKGETFLNPQLFNIVKWLKEEFAFTKVMVISNGTIPPSNSGEIVKYIDKVNFSIDGATKGTFDKIRVPAKFEQVKDTIKKWNEAKLRYNSQIQFGFCVCLSALNLAELPDLIQLAYDTCNAENVYCQPMEVLDNQSGMHQYSLTHLPAAQIKRALSQAQDLSQKLGMRLDMEHILTHVLAHSEWANEEQRMYVDFSKNCYCSQLWKDIVQVKKDGSLDTEFVCCYLDDYDGLFKKYDVPITGGIIGLINSKEMWQLRRDFLQGKCLSHCKNCLHGQTGYESLCNYEIVA